MPCTLFWEPMIHCITPPTPFLNQHLIRHLLSPPQQNKGARDWEVDKQHKGSTQRVNIGFVFNQPGNSFSPFWTFALNLEVYYQIWTVTSWFSAKGMQCHRSFLVLLFPKLHSSPLAHWVTRPEFSSVPILRLLLRPRLFWDRDWDFFWRPNFLRLRHFWRPQYLRLILFLDRYQSKTLKNNGNSLVKEAVKTFF